MERHRVPSKSPQENSTKPGESEWVLEGEVTPVVSSWTEERCEELWDRVEGVRHKLTRILNPAKLTPYLRQCKVIDEQDEDEVLNSTQLPLRISKAGRLLDILRGRGPRGLQAFMESLEFYHPEQYTHLTGQQATQRCSMMLDEEGPEGLTQFLLLEVRKLREQLRNSRMCERRFSQRCRVAEDERSRAEKKNQDFRQELSQLERLKLDWEAGSRELGRLKERLLEQAVKYSRALEEQRKSSNRERDLLTQVEQLKNRLAEVEKSASGDTNHSKSPRSMSGTCTRAEGLNGLGTDSTSAGQVAALQRSDTLNGRISETQALLDILKQDQREAAEQRHELCTSILSLQGELESAEASNKKLESQCEQLQVKLRTLQLDWEAEHKRSLSYFNQIMELERERDQALRSRDSLQLEFTDCLLDKNRLRKRITELQGDVERLQIELDKEKEKNQQQEFTHSQSCSHGSFLSLISEERCFGPCCSLSLTPYDRSNQSLSNSQNSEHAEDLQYTSEEDLFSPVCGNAKEINRLSTFPFPPCINSINRRVNTEFDLDSWGSDETSNITDTESSTSLHSHLFFPDSPATNTKRTPESNLSPPTPPKNSSLADDITIIGGNRTGIFVQTVRAGSVAERCGLTEGTELIQLEQEMFSGGGVDMTQCTAEVAHFTMQWWNEPAALKHRPNHKGYSALISELSSDSFTGADSFYVRVNLDLCFRDQPGLSVGCNDVLHVTDTRYNGKYQWRCSRVDVQSGKALQKGAVPNYNRAQQLLLVNLRSKKKFGRKFCERVRLVKPITAKYSGVGSSHPVLYTLSNRNEEHPIPYSLVQPVHVESKRPVIFSPSVLSRGLIERLLQPADSGLYFNTCQPEPIAVSERDDKSVFMLDHTHTSDHTLGIRLQSIQEVIDQDKHCLLQLSVSNVEALLKHGVYPIIIHIIPKDKKGRKFRKLLGCFGDRNVMEVMQMESVQLEMLPLMFTTLQPNDWSCTNELINTVRTTIHTQQGALVWLEMDRIQ
ncbi:caspase recruitment domain-containing protein 10-like [Trichomycterus rosablanca]|uniref:caspase recruitment domain-containing protein 10-like n=1 Tax=Trichomycterus rosablanca TaxID=2290929 RepID=UPI002F35E6F7